MAIRSLGRGICIRVMVKLSTCRTKVKRIIRVGASTAILEVTAYLETIGVMLGVAVIPAGAVVSRELVFVAAERLGRDVVVPLLVE